MHRLRSEWHALATCCLKCRVEPVASLSLRTAIHRYSVAWLPTAGKLGSEWYPGPESIHMGV
jgi:hypothetical protein